MGKKKRYTTHTPESALEFVEYLAREIRWQGIKGNLNAKEIAKYIERGIVSKSRRANLKGNGI